MNRGECQFDGHRCFNKAISNRSNYCFDHSRPVIAPLQQCEYVSNRTRLHCPNVRPQSFVDKHGFCEDHSNFIERLRRSAVKQRKILDPGFRSERKSLNDDESSTDEEDETEIIERWPHVQESTYDDSRILDDEHNPLRNAGVVTTHELVHQSELARKRQKEAVAEYQSLLVDNLTFI
jgi:hypothetical protein